MADTESESLLRAQRSALSESIDKADLELLDRMLHECHEPPGEQTLLTGCSSLLREHNGKWQCYHHDLKQCLLLLIHAGATVSNDAALLESAVVAGCVDCTRLLILHGAAVQRTPLLFIAIRAGHLKLARWLVRIAGLSPSQVNADGQTPLECAGGWILSARAKLERAVEFDTLFREHGVAATRIRHLALETTSDMLAHSIRLAQLVLDYCPVSHDQIAQSLAHQDACGETRASAYSCCCCCVVS